LWGYRSKILGIEGREGVNVGWRRPEIVRVAMLKRQAHHGRESLESVSRVPVYYLI